MQNEIIFVLGLISLSLAILVPASLGQDNGGINDTTMNNTESAMMTINLTQNTTLQNLSLLNPVNLTIGSMDGNLSDKTLNETSADIVSDADIELTTGMVMEEVAISNASAPINAILNESKDGATNAMNINVTTNLTASSINRDARTEADAPIKQDETFMLGKAVENKKPFEIMHLTNPMMDVSKQVFLSNIV